MRYTIDIPEKLNEIANGIAKQEQILKSEFLRRAILLYSVLHAECVKGKSVAIVKDGVIEREIIGLVASIKSEDWKPS